MHYLVSSRAGIWLRCQSLSLHLGYYPAPSVSCGQIQIPSLQEANFSTGGRKLPVSNLSLGSAMPVAVFSLPEVAEMSERLLRLTRPRSYSRSCCLLGFQSNSAGLGEQTPCQIWTGRRAAVFVSGNRVCDTNSLGSVPCPSCHTHRTLQQQMDDNPESANPLLVFQEE